MNITAFYAVVIDCDVTTLILIFPVLIEINYEEKPSRNVIHGKKPFFDAWFYWQFVGLGDNNALSKVLLLHQPPTVCIT